MSQSFELRIIEDGTHSSPQLPHRTQIRHGRRIPGTHAQQNRPHEPPPRNRTNTQRTQPEEGQEMNIFQQREKSSKTSSRHARTSTKRKPTTCSANSRNSTSQPNRSHCQKNRRSRASMSPRMMVGSCLRTSMMTGRHAHVMTRLIPSGMAIDSMQSGRKSAKRSRLKHSR